MEARVYTIVLSKVDIRPVYKAIRRACKGYDLPMYLPLEGGELAGAYYFVATPIDFMPNDMTELLNYYEGKCTVSYAATFPKEHFNHEYEVSLHETMGMNLGKYILRKVSPVYYGDTTLNDAEEYKAMFDGL